MWTKGQSGNPAGRPKEEKSITSMLRKHGKRRVVERDGKTMSRQEAIALDMWEEALGGNARVREYIVNRLDGMPTQRNENKNIEMPKVVGYYPADFVDDSADSEDPATDTE